MKSHSNKLRITSGYYFEYQMRSTDSKSLRKLLTTKTK
jgi:hypothetical protein